MSKFLFAFLLVCLFVFSSAKLSPILQSELEQSQKVGKKIDVLIMMKDQVDFKSLGLSKMDHEQKGVAVLESVMSIAEKTQKNLVSLLQTMGASYTTYYVQNCIVVNGLTAAQILTLNTHGDIEFILSNRAFKVALEALPVKVEEGPSAGQAQIEWNLEFSKATGAWSKNITGKGFTVANADTGVYWEHESLKANYRGNQGATVDHNYAWWDGVRTRINPRGNRCGYNTTAPCDDHGHGTHTTGTAAGNNKNTRRVGVAPEANWIACRNMDAGDGRPQSYIECLQFFLAPHDLTGKNPKPELRPVSIGNSYGCPRAERCEQDTLKQASDALRAAGVFMAVSAGNYGSCSSVRDPPSHYASVISIGASGFKSHSIASYSSKGPVTIDGSNRMKPELTAPGSSVVGPLPGGPNRYGGMSGTSMASPHVNGAVALLWQASKKLWRDIDATQKLLEKTAVAQNTTLCSSNGGTPNNVYGYGSIDLLKAVEEALRNN